MESVHLIQTEADYKAALARAEQLMVAKAGTAQGDELARLAMVIEAYEDEHYPIEPPDPTSAIFELAAAKPGKMGRDDERPSHPGQEDMFGPEPEY